MWPESLSKPHKHSISGFTPQILQRACACGQHTVGGGECAECRKKREAGALQREANGAAPVGDVPPIVHDVLRAPGQPLDAATRAFMEPHFGHDFSGVRVHTGGRAAESASAVNALAYTVGRDVVFGTGQFAPGTAAGQRLLAHELTHVVQQGSGSAATTAGGGAAHEAEADRAADAIGRGAGVASVERATGASVQRKVEMRDVGRGEQSGIARLPELIKRLNAASQGLTYAMTGRELTYRILSGGTISGFDRQMMAFIDQDPVIPLRLTNRHGLEGNRTTGFNDRVLEDTWSSGYVDIDDLLASSNLGMQSVLVHFLRERSATTNYAHRIGSPSLDTQLPGPQREFERVHALGIEAELQLLRDFFSDPTIRLVALPTSGNIFRVYRNSRRDRFRTRLREGRGANRGVDTISIEVVTPDGQVHTPEEYLAILEAERTARQVERERLGGATEHQEGGRGIPAP